MPELNKYSVNNLTICEAPPFLVLFVRHVVIVSIPFPYTKCHDFKLVVILFPILVNFILHPSLENWLQLWSEYSPKVLVWVIINKTLYMYLVDVLPVKWLLLVVIIAWMSCRACLSLITLGRWMIVWVIIGVWSFTDGYIVYWIWLMIR